MDTKLWFWARDSTETAVAIFWSARRSQAFFKVSVRKYFSYCWSKIKLTSFSNWRTACPIQFHVTFSTPVYRLKLSSLSNWPKARPIQFDVTVSTPFPSLKLTYFLNWRTARPIQFDVTYPNFVSGLKLTSFFELADGTSHTVRCNIFYSCC